ncbi:MAG TPA: hypothetical protein VNU46_07060, partial [Gemmatimonadaceae bacterium]|nr:hypothetical protein [Gemmatimonadaceae bacterium]
MHLVSDIVQVLAIVLALVLAAIGLLSIIRSTPVRVVIAPGTGEEPPGVGDSLFAKTMELYTGTTLSLENQVELLLNG